MARKTGITEKELGPRDTEQRLERVDGDKAFEAGRKAAKETFGKLREMLAKEKESRK